MEKDIYDYEKRLERVLIRITNAKNISDNDKEMIFKFKLRKEVVKKIYDV